MTSGVNIRWWAALAAMLWLGTVGGCPATEVEEGDDDDAADDDAADDDTADDDSAADDDDDDTTPPPDPYGFSIDVAVNVDGAESTTDFVYAMVDENQNTLCEIELQFGGTYSEGAGQGDDYYAYLDSVITWTDFVETSNNCAVVYPAYSIYKADPVAEWMWDLHPLASVSCDLIGDVVSLGDTFVGEDVFSVGADGTFTSWCEVVGGAIQSNGTGPAEGVWLAPGAANSLPGNFAYLEPAGESANVESWFLMGMLMADPANGEEPMAGMAGDYIYVPIWMWIYG